MTITTMLTNEPKHGMVRQGFFRRERFRPQPATGSQARAPDFWAGKAPRPQLLPTKRADGGPTSRWRRSRDLPWLRAPATIWQSATA